MSVLYLRKERTSRQGLGNGSSVLCLYFVINFKTTKQKNPTKFPQHHNWNLTKSQ